MHVRAAYRAALIGGWLFTAGVFASAPADVVREGTGPRRDALNRMELTPFDGGLWSKLAAWSGDPVDASRTNGQVVLICTWSSWYLPSIRQGLAVAERLHEKFAGQGLVVVGVHHPEGWAGARAAADGAGVKFAYAHDASGAVREALKVDQDPDFYVIDRAGHLRYADIATGSVEVAVAELIAESRDMASDLPRLIKEREDEARRLALASEPIRANFELDRLPPVPPGYVQPDPEAYTAAKWPTFQAPEAGRAVGLVDQNGKPVAPPLNFQPTQWFPAEPPVAGRVIVIYLWHPEIRESYRVFGEMDALQRSHPRDLAVIGALTPLRNLRGNQSFNEVNEETTETLGAKLAQFMRARNFEHAVAADFGATAFLSMPQNTGGGGGGEGLHPRVIVASSDGSIRFIGWYERHTLRTWLDAILAADPGVAARRRADRVFIENRPR